MKNYLWRVLVIALSLMLIPLASAVGQDAEYDQVRIYTIRVGEGIIHVGR